MLIKTRGIVVKSTKYSETSVVLQILTEELGLQSYLLNGIRKAKSKYSPVIMQSLQLLDLVVYHQEGKGIQRIAEVRNQPAYQDIPFSTLKSSLLLFLNEVIYKSIKQGHQDQELFNFLFDALLSLDASKEFLADFHIGFLIGLTSILGLAPTQAGLTSSPGTLYFDIKNGLFQVARPNHPSYADPQVSAALAAAIVCFQAGTRFVSQSTPLRRALVELLLEYYSWHVEGFGIVRSWDILAEVYK